MANKTESHHIVTIFLLPFQIPSSTEFEDSQELSSNPGQKL